MPDIRMPDGQVVRFPDDMPREQIQGMIASKFPEVNQPQVGIAEDVAKSGGSGVVRGTMDLIGLPGTIGDALRGGLQAGLSKGYEFATGGAPSPYSDSGVERFFAGPTPELEAQLIGGGKMLGSGQKLRDVASAVTGGASDYQPKTTAGEYARTVGEFAPSAVLGPGNLVRKAAMATVPAVTSETAGQLTEGTAWEPWARAGGAILGGLASAGRANPVKMAAKEAPTADVLKGQTDALYGALRNAGIKYDSNAWGATVQSMNNELLKSGLRPSVAKEAFGLVDDLMKQANHSLDFDDINGLVQMTGGAARDAARAGNNTLAKAFGIVRDQLDDFERNAPLISSANVPRNVLNEARSTARTLALRNIKQRALDDVMQRADTYAAGVDAGMRNGINNLVRSKKGAQLFTGAERTALLQVSQGRKPIQQLAKFGFDLTSIGGNAAALPTAGAGLAYAMGGALPAAALSAGGTVAKAVGPRLTQAALDRTAAAIRSGGLTGQRGQQALNLMNEQLVRRRLIAPMALEAYQIPEARKPRAR